MKAEELALNPAHPPGRTRGAPSRAGTETRSPSCGRGRAARSPSPRCCWPPSGWSRRCRRPTRAARSSPASRRRPRSGDFGFVLYRNGLVLALHAMACVAGFMAGSSLPQVAEGYSGLWRKIHDKAGPLAIGFVIAATIFSLATQAYALGHGAADLSHQLGLSPLVLLIGAAPARAAGADRALPAAGGVDAGLAPARVGGAARRHHRHRGRRGPGADRRGGRRDVGDAGAPRYTF